MQKIAAWWHYWRENIETAKGGFDMTMLVGAIILAIVAAASGLANYFSQSPSDIVNPYIPGWCGAGAAVLFSFWGFLWLPFHRHEKQQAKHEAENTVNEAIIKALKQKLDDREKFKFIDEELGKFRLTLEDRVCQIKELGFFGYANKYEQHYDRGALDPDSDTLLGQIDAFLKVTIGGSSVAVFEDITNITRTPMNTTDSKMRYKQFAVDLLNHRINQLTKIIDKYVENKGENK